MKTPRWMVMALGCGLAVLSGPKAPAQTTPPKGTVTAPRDASLEAAEALIGRALFVRGFYFGDELAYDAAGRVQGSPKTGDWTLAGVDVLKAQRRQPGEILLEGVRVAIRYNQDNHQFERHPQNDEKVRIRVADAADWRGMEAALDSIFAQGIDPRLQRATPPYWQHFFNPALEWLPNSPDSLAGQTIFATNGLPNPAKDMTPPSLARRVDLKMPQTAVKGKIKGTISCG